MASLMSALHLRDVAPGELCSLVFKLLSSTGILISVMSVFFGGNFLHSIQILLGPPNHFDAGGRGGYGGNMRTFEHEIIHFSSPL